MIPFSWYHRSDKKHGPFILLYHSVQIYTVVWGQSYIHRPPFIYKAYTCYCNKYGVTLDPYCLCLKNFWLFHTKVQLDFSVCTSFCVQFWHLVLLILKWLRYFHADQTLHLIKISGLLVQVTLECNIIQIILPYLLLNLLIVIDGDCTLCVTLNACSCLSFQNPLLLKYCCFCCCCHHSTTTTTTTIQLQLLLPLSWPWLCNICFIINTSHIICV